PDDYGVNDIPLIVQDRNFDRSGRMSYDLGMMGVMQGFRGSEILVNGAIRPKLTVPGGLVRLRVLNASNARIYDFSFADGRTFHQVGTDGGLLPAPVARTTLQLAPAERAEIVVDFADRAPARLVSRDVGSGGMMGGGSMMGGSGMMNGGGNSGSTLEVMSFDVGDAAVTAPASLPKTLPSDIRDMGEPVRTRSFRLNLHGGGMMGSMFNTLIGRDGQAMGINGDSYDMNRIDQAVQLNETELWRIDADMQAHPFHVHGTSFQVISQGGRAVDPQQVGLKDVVLVDGPTEILVRFDKRATAETPFMYHCHILEHEDAGMMGQFTVS
ncbi:MAG: multicopper oxidase domain-containing protein, partial [Alphaproteobacteria bacterium]|nr:multicopper oxidase domain-containing protein [Alphaproteobacteria bacterium]